MGHIYVKALGRLIHALIASIMGGKPVQQVADHPFAQRLVGHAHALDTQAFKNPHQHGQPAGEDRLTVIGQTRQRQFVDLAGLAHGPGQFFQRIGRNHAHRVFDAGGPQDGLDTAGGADRARPAGLSIRVDQRLERDARGHHGRLPAGLVDLAVAEEPTREGHRPQRDTFDVSHLGATADD